MLFSKRGESFHQNFTKIKNYHQGNTTLDEIGTSRCGLRSEEQTTVESWQLSLWGVACFNKAHHMQCINKCKMGNK